MKRLNPNTNEPFKRGDAREDGFVFFNYTTKIKADGYFLERWLRPDVSEKRKLKDRANKKAKYQRKSQRHSPGFTELKPLVKSAIHLVQRLNDEQKAYGDLTPELAAEDLLGYDLTSEEWDIVVEQTQPHAFDLKEAIRLALSI